ncbi:MAG: type IV pilin protein [Pseudomonadota bacterium]
MNQVKASSAMRRQHGFTLIELMVTMVIIGILAAIAYPSYVQYLLKSNRAAAQAHMLDIALQEQQYLADSRSYAATVAMLTMTTPDAVASKYSIVIAVDAGPPPRFTITATPILGTKQVEDGPLTIDSAGVKTPSAKW